jgi:hypothetical protein
MTPAQSQYPHDLAGEETGPPETPDAELVAAWREYEAAEAAELDAEPLLSAAGDWRMAGSLVTLLDEADAANPRRDRSSDGGIGNARHQQLGKSSDHNPWVVVKGVGVVRARDFDVDGLDVAAAFERLRAKAAAGQLPQVTGGGYAIVAARITAEDWSGWREYHGENPHVTHGHVSVSTDPGRFDDRRPWHIWTPAAAPTRPAKGRPAPAPAPATPAAGDLRGRAFDLRGEQGATGPRVRGLQQFLVRVYPRYARGLAQDGVWGPQTSAVVREFAQRSGIRSADGLNIGPQLARRLYLVGFRG